MRKSDKKLDNQIRLALTDVCETALKHIEGFQWLTHIVNYSDFPKSLQVICVFDTNNNLMQYKQSGTNQGLAELIESKCRNLGIKINNIDKHLGYDTEEDCNQQHAGNWALRLS